MNNYKLYVENMFRTTIKGDSVEEIEKLALTIYGYGSNIRVVCINT